MDPTQPNVSVGLQELISGTYDPASSNVPPATPKLSLTVPPPGLSAADSGAIHRNLPSHPSSAKRQAALDLQHTDILGPSEVIKQLLTLPYTHGNEYFALHRLGNTLVLDSVSGMGDHGIGGGYFPAPPSHGDDSQRRIGSSGSGSGRKNTHPYPHDSLVTSSGPPEESLLDKLHHLEHLDIDSEASSPLSSSSSSGGGGSGISSMYSNSLGSTYLPPPEYYLPQQSQQHSQPFRQVLRWQVSDARPSATSAIAMMHR